jgi:tetratricopeptide (TPR) repeat protein
VRQSVGLLIALLLGTTPMRAAARAPADVDFTGYLQKSHLTRLYVTELRNLCLEGDDLAACREYLAFLKADSRSDRALTFADSLSRESRHADPAIQMIRAGALVDASKYSESIAVLDEIIASLPPRDALVEAVFLRAACRFELGQTDEALINLRSVEPYATDSQAAEFAVLLAQCEEAGGNLGRAETLYKEALDQEGSGDAAVGILRCRLKRGDVAGFFDRRTEVERRRAILPPGPASELAIAVGELIPEAWHALMGLVIADPDLRSVAGRRMVNSIVDLAESGEPVDRYCDSLLTLDLDAGLKDRLRYAWALSQVESTWAADTLASLAGRASQSDIGLRSAVAAITHASEEARPVLATALAPGILRCADLLSAEERFELASLLVDSGLMEQGVDLAWGLSEDLDLASNSAKVSIAMLLEKSGRPDMAREMFEMAAGSLIPTEDSLEGRKRAYLLEDTAATSTAPAGLAGEVERIAREGASDVQLGDLFTRLGDFKRASKHYSRALDASPDGGDADAIKMKLISSLGHQWLQTGDNAARRKALDLVDAISDSPEVGPGAVRTALDLATDWLRLDQDRAFAVAQKLSHRDHQSSRDLYEAARILYSLFLKRDGNVYTECVLALGLLLDDFPTSPEAPAAALLLGRAKFAAGDYVGALEAYESCLAEYDEPRIERLCRIGIGECYLYSGGSTDALVHFKHAGDSPAAMYNAGRCHELGQEDDSAQVYYRRSLSVLSEVVLSDAARLRLGLLTLERDGIDAAMGELDSPVPVVRERLHDARRIVRAYGLGRAGYRDMAVAELERLAGEGGMFACDALLLAASIAGRDAPAEARSLLEPGRERCVDIFGILKLLEDRASYACSDGSLELCARERRAFKQRFPLAVRTQLGMDIRALLLLFREGEADSASKVLEGLRTRGRGHDLLAQAIYRQGIDRMVEGDYPGAAEAFMTIERDYPDHELYRDACFKLGTAYYMAGDYDSSAEYFAIASESNKASLVENAFFNLGLALEKQGDLARAARAFWSLAVRFPLSERFDRSLMRTAYALERAGEPKEAIRIYKGLLNYAEDRETAAEAVYWIGESFSEMGDHARAAVEFLRVGHLFPGEAAWAGTACYRAGVECEAAGLTDHAIAIYGENVRRFGKDTDWGKASGERLAELTRGGEPEEPPVEGGEQPSGREEVR